MQLFVKPFFKLLSFRVLIVLAYQIMAIVVGWHIYELTHDTLALGLIGLAEVIPYFCCALFAGYAVDHYSRRMFGVLASLMLFLTALTLAAVSAGWTGGNPSRWIYGSIAFTGVARAFIGPSYSTLFALILRRDQYARASGIGSSVFQFGLVAGPALGGILVGWAGKTTAYGVAAGLCLVAALALLSLRIEAPPAAAGAPIFTSIAEGLRFVFGNQIILGAQSLDMFAVLFGGAVSMLPAFIHDVFHYGPEGLGVLRAAPAVGAVMTGLLLARYPINLHAGRWLLGRIWLVHDRLCPIGKFLGCRADIDTLRCFRRGIRGHAHDHPATGDTRCHARPGFRYQRYFYWLIQRVGRF
jgi:MFS family permease